MNQALLQEGREYAAQLENRLKRADQASHDYPDLYATEFGLDSSHLEYVPWLTQTENNVNCLRADPVILEPTHNGILCRGNEILHLAQDEREEIESLFNQHFSVDGLKLSLDSPSTGIVEIAEQPPAEFASLKQVLGQDISNYLPGGPAGGYWQQVLMETQMLLHRAECNINRREQGEKTIDSLWFWGKTEQPAAVSQPQNSRLYSDHPVVQQAFGLPGEHAQIPDIKQLIDTQQPATVHTWQLEKSVIQFDTTTWEQSYIRCLDSLLFPALQAVKDSQLKCLEIITEDRQYTARAWHRWRFWR
jgi:hypothetical protein